MNRSNSSGYEKVARKLWNGWKQTVKKIGDFQARLILTVLYFVIIAPFALIVRCGADPLSLKKGVPPGWRLKTERENDAIKRAIHQF